MAVRFDAEHPGATPRSTAQAAIAREVLRERANAKLGARPGRAGAGDRGKALGLRDMDEAVRTCAELRGVCRAQIEALGRAADLDFTLTPERISNGLERKGVVCRDEDGRYVVPIPSMVTWAQHSLRDRGRRPSLPCIDGFGARSPHGP